MSWFGNWRRRGSACLAFYPDGVAMAWVVAQQGGEPVLRAMAYARDFQQVAGWVLQWKLAKVPFVALFHPRVYPLLTVPPPHEVPRLEWPAHLRWRISDRLDFPVEEAVVELFESPLVTSQPVVYVVATRRQEVRQCAAFFQQHKLHLASITIWELALAGLINLLRGNDQPLGVLYLDDQVSLFLVVEQDSVQLVRRLVVGEPVGRLVEELVREVKRGVDYYEEHADGKMVAHLLLLSPQWSLQELQSVLAQRLHLAVSTWLEMAGSVFPGSESEEMELCLPAIGAAWRREMGQ